MVPCELCEMAGGAMLWESTACRVVRVADPHYPDFCRVVWKEHVREMSDLDPHCRRYLMDVVFAVEGVLRALCRPDKINLASLGNLTPHLHWHVIPRWQDDRHFPEPVWGQVRREASSERSAVDERSLRAALGEALAPYATLPWR